MVRVAYLEAAATATDLLAAPAVGAAWTGPSALPGFTVGGLAGHLARQIFRVPDLLAQDQAGDPPIALLDHYARSRWVAAAVDDEANVRIRGDGEQEAAGGPSALVARTATALQGLRDVLPDQPADRVVHLPWGPWSLSLDDFLVTRMLEITVHTDDLACSIGVHTPAFPPAAVDPVVALLSQIAVRRHGVTAVLRALSRSERAPATIAAI